LKVRVQLKGQLYWYDKENRKEIQLEGYEIKTPRDIIKLLNIPASEVQMVIVNDNRIELDDEIGDGDVIVFMPVISGG